MRISAVFFFTRCNPDPLAFLLTDGADKGIIPLTCSELFSRTEAKEAADPNLKFTVEVSYIEVRRAAVHWAQHAELNLRCS